MIFMKISKNSSKPDQPLYAGSVVLFPNTTIDAAGIRDLLDHFSQVTLCRPWFMGEVDVDGVASSSLRIRHPPEELKPEQDPKRLVSEYQTWMNQHQGKGHAAFVETNHTEPPTWEIRQALRRMSDRGESQAVENPALKWHLVLHLAAIFEQSRSEADALLRRLKAQGSPLETALEDPADLPGPLSDVSLTDPPLLANDHHMRQIFEAWLGLFGKQIPVREALVTGHPHIFEYASTVFDRATTTAPLNKTESDPRMEDMQKAGLQFQNFPVLAERETGSDPVMAGLSGRTLILLKA